jgi:hypothetical protein
MRRNLKKLTLNRETLRRLVPAELQRVEGAATAQLCLPPTRITCPTFKICPTQFGLSCVEFCTPSEAGQCS